MSARPPISVCMATYNGAAYVSRQITSILAEFGPDDELIIVDDCSKDDTVSVISAIADPRIRLLVNERNRREVYSFGRAIGEARNPVIFTSDQDDIWVPGRAALMANALMDQGALLVTTNFEWMDSAENPIDIPFDGVSSARSSAHLGNILEIFVGKTNYFGCAMAFRRELLPVILPIPGHVESHDLWIALAGNIARSNVHLDASTLRKRQHGNNATSTVSRRSLYLKLRARAIFVQSILTILARGGLRTKADAARLDP